MAEKSSPRELSLDDVKSLRWLADAPLFIDAEQVGSFYDAVVSPEAEEMSVTRSIKDSKKQAAELGLEGGGEISVSQWLKLLFPFLDAKLSATAKATGSVERATESESSIELRPIRTPQRQLVQLALHYIIDLPNRVRFVTLPTDLGWTDTSFIDATPRCLLFLELSPGTILIPTATELATGEVALLYRRLERQSGERPPRYPDREAEEDAKKLYQRRKEYWSWFSQGFFSRQAMETIEGAARAGGRIRWIDYRLPLDTEGTTVHLHVQGHETYDTGVFAYNMVKRGAEHGLRLVGTLKSGPDVNVLAVFER
jgi:hypothetical protein